MNYFSKSLVFLFSVVFLSISTPCLADNSKFYGTFTGEYRWGSGETGTLTLKVGQNKKKCFDEDYLYLPKNGKYAIIRGLDSVKDYQTEVISVNSSRELISVTTGRNREKLNTGWSGFCKLNYNKTYKKITITGYAQDDLPSEPSGKFKATLKKK